MPVLCLRGRPDVAMSSGISRFVDRCVFRVHFFTDKKSFYFLISTYFLFLKQATIPRSVNWNSNRNPNKSIRILIEPGQLIPRTVTVQLIHELKEHKIHSLM